MTLKNFFKYIKNHAENMGRDHQKEYKENINNYKRRSCASLFCLAAVTNGRSYKTHRIISVFAFHISAFL